MTIKIPKISIIILVLLLFTKPSFAEDSILSWSQCVDLVRENNNNLKSAIAREKATNYQTNATLSDFLPQASANFSSNRSKSDRNELGIIDQNYNSSLAVTQNLFSGFSDVGAFRRAKANNLISKANLNLTKAQVSYQLKSSYANYIYAKETVSLLNDIIKRRDYNLRIIELRFKSGMENKGSLLLAQSYLQQAKYDLFQASNLIDTSRFALCEVLGTDNCNIADIKGTVPTTENSSNKIDFPQIAQTTPQYAQIAAQEEAAKAGIVIAKSGFFPSADITLANGQIGNSVYPKHDYWSVNMNVSVPLFMGGRNYYTTKSAYSESAAARQNREAIQKQILVNLQQNYSAYIESITKLKVDENFKEASEMRADIARNKYNNGLLTFENWDIIETDLINRQKAYLLSKRNRVTSEALWEQIQGKGVFSND